MPATLIQTSKIFVIQEKINLYHELPHHIVNPSSKQVDIPLWVDRTSTPIAGLVNITARQPKDQIQ